NTDSFTLTFTTASSDGRAACAASYTLVSSTTSEATTASSLDAQNVFGSSVNAYVGRSYPALLVAAVHWQNLASSPAVWQGGFTQNASATGGGVSTQISLASKLVVFSTAIVAQIDWKADAQSSPAGTVSTTNNSNIVTGAGTTLSVFFPGDEIIAGGETQIVDHVTSNTQLETVGSWVTTQAGVAFTRRSGPRVITAALSGSIYKDAPFQGGNTGNLDATVLVSSLTTSRHRGRFVQAGKESAAQNRKLFYFNG